MEKNKKMFWQQIGTFFTAKNITNLIATNIKNYEKLLWKTPNK